jgi:hypothetical protein
VACCDTGHVCAQCGQLNIGHCEAATRRLIAFLLFLVAALAAVSVLLFGPAVFAKLHIGLLFVVVCLMLYAVVIGRVQQRE